MASRSTRAARSAAPFWSGMFPAITTQMHADGSLDLPATADHIEALLASGCSGLVMLGSLGENQTLLPEEKRIVVRLAVEVVGGRVPVLSGVAETNLRAATAYTRDAEKIGLDGFMLMPSMCYKPTDPAEILGWFGAVAKATRLPIMVYNNPIAYGNDITPEMFVQLAKIRNLVAIKESSGNTRRITDLRNAVGGRYALFTGVDPLAMESCALGIDGWVSGSGIATPVENQYIWELLQAGRFAEARPLWQWFTPLLHLDTDVKFVQYIKLLVQEAGLGREFVRAPRQPLKGAERRRVLEVIHAGLKNRPKLPKNWKPGAIWKA